MVEAARLVGHAGRFVDGGLRRTNVWDRPRDPFAGTMAWSRTVGEDLGDGGVGAGKESR